MWITSIDLVVCSLYIYIIIIITIIIFNQKMKKEISDGRTIIIYIISKWDYFCILWQMHIIISQKLILFYFFVWLNQRLLIIHCFFCFWLFSVLQKDIHGNCLIIVYVRLKLYFCVNINHNFPFMKFKLMCIFNQLKVRCFPSKLTLPQEPWDEL